MALQVEEDVIHVAMASNRRYLPGLRATTVSLIKAASEPKRLMFHVFSDGLTQEDKDSLVVQARRFGYDGSFDFREPNMKKMSCKFKEYNGSLTPFLRLYFPEEFPDIDWLLWSDVDVLWFRDPVSFWSERESAATLVWVRDIPSSRKAAVKLAKFPVHGDWKDYACSGVMLMNLRRMREMGFVQKSADFVARWGSPHFADQDIFNYLCGDNAKLVDSRWDLLYPISSVEDGVVIHFNGIGPKFNDTSFTGWSPLYEIWFRFVRQVIEGRVDEGVCPYYKVIVFNLLRCIYPMRRVVAFFVDRLHPWVSDFIQRTLLFSWLRRKRLWA